MGNSPPAKTGGGSRRPLSPSASSASSLLSSAGEGGSPKTKGGGGGKQGRGRRGRGRGRRGRRGLFDELGVPLLRRPSPYELRQLWNVHDVDRNDSLDRDGCSDFLRDVSKRWGGGKWTATDSGGAGGSASASRKGPKKAGVRANGSTPSAYLLASAPLSLSSEEPSEKIAWDAVLSELWNDEEESGPLRDVPASTALLFQRRFRRAMDPHTERIGSPERAGEVLRELLLSAGATSEAVRKAGRSVHCSAGGGVSFESFLKAGGRAHAEATEARQGAFAGLGDPELEGDLPPWNLRNIRSFAPVRRHTRVEILNCGEAAMTSMLHLIKSATTEIMMSWREFLPGLPAVRSAELGNAAWSNEDGTLPSILKSKAEAGVMVYILLWDIPDAFMPTAPLVEHAAETLGRLHPNIHVVDHPGLTVWSRTHHQKFVVVDRNVAVLGGIDWTLGRWDSPSHPLFDPTGAARPGVELRRVLSRDFFRRRIKSWWERPERDPLDDRGEQLLLPWQDVAIRVHGDAACDVALNFIHRWEHARRDVLELFGDGLRNGVPEIPIQFRFRGVPDPDGGVVCPADRESMDPAGFASPGTRGECKCQIVRSLGRWSGGLQEVETSHYQAWTSAIGAAERFIYIEQQYFIANMGEGAAKNRVAEAILDRVRVAVEESRPFRVYVVIPERVEAEAVSYFTRRTLLQDGNDGELCLMSRIRAVLATAEPGSYWDGEEAESLLSVCTLYAVGRSASGRWDVGEIFVHSKVLICDDRVAVIGSANVNDRSFVGHGDSELGAIVWDRKADGSEGMGAVADFRCRLWRQYLSLAKDGSQDNLIEDPSSKQVYFVWDRASQDNLRLLNSVTGWTPRNSIRSFGQWKKLLDQYNRKTPDQKAAVLSDPDRLMDMKGQLVKYPPRFLSDQNKRSVIEAVTTTLPLPREYFL